MANNDDSRGSPYLLIRDIERCPYIPRDPEYNEWNHRDEERCLDIHNRRKNMVLNAQVYLNSDNPTVREMAIFIDWFFNRK